MQTKIYPTVGNIAQQCGVQSHRVLYAISVLGLKPIGRAGIARVYSDADAKKIGEYLQRRQAANRALAGDAAVA